MLGDLVQWYAPQPSCSIFSNAIGWSTDAQDHEGISGRRASGLAPRESSANLSSPSMTCMSNTPILEITPESLDMSDNIPCIAGKRSVGRARAFPEYLDINRFQLVRQPMFQGRPSTSSTEICCTMEDPSSSPMAGSELHSVALN